MKPLLIRLALTISALCLSVCCYAQWDKDVLEFRGRLALQDGKYSQAIDQFNILARIDTSNCWTFFYRGIAKFNLGDLRGAQNDFDRSIRINPLFTNGYHYRAITKSRFGKYEEALEDLQQAIDLRPGFYGLYYSRGVTYFLAQKFEDAVTDFNKYIEHEPKDPSAYLNRGATFLFLADTTRALSDYNRAIKLDRFEAEGYVRRARLYAAQEQFPQAIKDMDYAIELDSTNTFAYFNRALMHFETKNYPKALKDFDKVLSYESGNALTLYNRSLVLSNLGDYEGALDDLDRVININPDNVLALFNRAGILMQLGRPRSALRDYDKAIELYPDFAKAYHNRSIVKMSLGMHKEARADQNTAKRKIEEYRKDGSSALADTTRNLGALIALDADFAKQGFNDELLQNRTVDVRLSPLKRVRASSAGQYSGMLAFANKHENAAMEQQLSQMPIKCEIASADTESSAIPAAGGTPSGQTSAQVRARELFAQGIESLRDKQYNKALSCYNAALAEETPDNLTALILMNRAALKAQMVEFIASIGHNVQTLSMDDQGSAKTRLSDHNGQDAASYKDALEDMKIAAALAPDNAYMHFNLANLYTLSTEMVKAIEEYNRSIELFPTMGEAHYNRALVLIFLKDREKGCIDLSRAGELGVADAYSVIKKYCEGND